MSGKITEIRDLLRGIGEAGAYEILDGTVDSVNESEFTIDVLLDEGVVLPDIRLRAVSNSGKAGMVSLPVVGSHIVFAQVRGEADYVLIKTSELDKILLEIDNTKLVVTDSGFEMSRNGVSMKQILTDLANLLKQFKVTTPSGPSVSVLPDTLLAITQFENKFNTLLNA